MTGVFNGIPLQQLQNTNNQDKRFKGLPPAESLPRSETLGGYIFVCNNDTMEDDLRRKLFGLPQRYRDSVRAIQPGLPLFLYNYTTHQLHGVYEATSFGGSNLDPNAWEDKKSRGESRFPAQVRIKVRKQCSPLDEDHFRPVLHHYDGPKFRLQLTVQETLNLLDLFEAVTSSKPATSPSTSRPPGAPPGLVTFPPNAPPIPFIRTPGSFNNNRASPHRFRGGSSSMYQYFGSPPGSGGSPPGSFLTGSPRGNSQILFVGSPPLSEYPGSPVPGGFSTLSYESRPISYAGTSPGFSRNFSPDQASFDVASFAYAMRPLSMV